ncbi:MAG: VOC family protein [Xanthobacteraceae bacterium]|nr:VOC family protein [Xanthobacteraceae bacterium]
MDAPNPSALPTFANRTPLRIGAVGLIARDLDRLTNYYRDLLGLTVMERTASIARLGTGGVTLLEIEHRPDARPDDPSTAGLYHTAFLMPTRADHARWIAHIAKNRVPITGASDHGVSEAFYLDDPEGNGIEVYNDRPRERWTWQNGLVVMQTKQLDIEAILDEIDRATATYPAAPEGLRIGHIHLRVGSIEQAEEFYRGPIGLELTRRRGGATFMSSGGYHHHVGANVWHSDRAGARDQNRAGLAWFSMELAEPGAVEAMAGRLRAANAPVAASPDGIETADPWGTRIRFVKAG